MRSAFFYVVQERCATDFEAQKFAKEFVSSYVILRKRVSRKSCWAVLTFGAHILPNLCFNSDFGAFNMVNPIKCFTFLWPEIFVNRSLRESNNIDQSFTEHKKNVFRLKPNLNCFSIKQACSCHRVLQCREIYPTKVFELIELMKVEQMPSVFTLRPFVHNFGNWFWQNSQQPW